MNKEEALNFLMAHQPLPPDAELTRTMIDKYDEVRRYFLEHPDADCVGPLLNSFGQGDGLGVYPLIGNVISKLTSNNVVPELKLSLRSTQRSVRYWSAQIAAAFPAADLMPALQTLLREDDFDVQYAALTALEQIGVAATPVVAEFARTEKKPELKSLAQDILQALART